MEAINARAAPPYENVDLFTIDRPLCGAVATYARLRRWPQRRRSQRRERESRVLGERLAILAAAAALRERPPPMIADVFAHTHPA